MAVLCLIVGLAVGGIIGVIVGLKYFGKRLDQIMAEWTPEQLQDLAKRVARRRS